MECVLKVPFRPLFAPDDFLAVVLRDDRYRRSWVPWLGLAADFVRPLHIASRLVPALLTFAMHTALTVGCRRDFRYVGPRPGAG